MKLHFVNIAPLYDDHVDEVVKDLQALSKKGDFDETAFKFTLVPEGTPAYDKAGMLGDIFVKYRDAMTKKGLKAGMLIQATMGHGWMPDSVSKFQKIVFPDMSLHYIHCPLDKEFQQYVHDAIAHLASLKPAFMMIDDDFRMLTGRNGCFCPLHVARFNALTGGNYTAESLSAAVSQDAVLKQKYYDFQRDTLNELAQIIRNAINETDPSIPCTFCACAFDLDHAPTITETLAAKKQPHIVRINNGRYLRNNPADFADWLFNTRCQQLALPDDYETLTEADTCPQNRYSSDSAVMHGNITLALLQGYAGAKLWITRLSDFQPNAGKDYRDTLGKYAGMYQAIRDMKPVWKGINVPILRKAERLSTQKAPDAWSQPPLFGVKNWGNSIFSLMGLPFRYDRLDDGPVMLADTEVDQYSDEAIRKLLKGTLLLDGNAASALAKRGFAKYLGYDDCVTPEQKVTMEVITTGPATDKKMTASPRAKVFVNLNKKAEALSQFYHRQWVMATEMTPQGPGAVRFRNSLGGTVITLGATIGNYDLDAFFMLNETRKQFLSGILEELGLLPVSYAGDARVICQYGTAGKQNVFYCCNTSDDVLKTIPLQGSAVANATFRQLLPDGSWKDLKPRRTANGVVLPVSLYTLHPVVFSWN